MPSLESLDIRLSRASRDAILVPRPEEVPIGELTKLCAVDNQLYEKTFFPKTARQTSPAFHRAIDRAFDSDARFIGVKIFRGGAKTSKIRLRTSKQIAYGISHTILFVSNSQGHSVKSIEWLKRQVEFNTKWAQTFNLRKGGRWTGEDIEIIHGVDEYPIRVLALGITGQVRGVNIDDYRPDLIVVDDADNEETTGSIEQIKKTNDLFFGALAKSLAPESEAPHAKMIFAQTPIAAGDIISSCDKDPQWLTLTFGCFDETGKSRWPERWTTEVLLADKQAHIGRRQLALWMREMECTIIPEGGASFTSDNLKYYDLLPERVTYIISIDPASSTSKTADDQVIMVLAFWRRNIYLVEYSAEQGEEQQIAADKTLEYVRRYNPLGVFVEAISYQRTLATFIESEMRRRRIYAPVHKVQDQRKKSDRILQSIGSATGLGNLYVKPTHHKFILQYARYSPKSNDHDDVLDACAIGIDAGTALGVSDWIEGEFAHDDDDSDSYSSSTSRQLEFRSCP